MLAKYLVSYLMCVRNLIPLVARLAQLVERKTLNLVVVGSSPTVGTLLDAAAFLSRAL